MSGSQAELVAFVRSWAVRPDVCVTQLRWQGGFGASARRGWLQPALGQQSSASPRRYYDCRPAFAEVNLLAEAGCADFAESGWGRPHVFDPPRVETVNKPGDGHPWRRFKGGGAPGSPPPWGGQAPARSHRSHSDRHGERIRAIAVRMGYYNLLLLACRDVAFRHAQPPCIRPNARTPDTPAMTAIAHHPRRTLNPQRRSACRRPHQCGGSAHSRRQYTSPRPSNRLTSAHNAHPIPVVRRARRASSCPRTPRQLTGGDAAMQRISTTSLAGSPRCGPKGYGHCRPSPPGALAGFSGGPASATPPAHGRS
ncbi:unnamed protein product [Acanthosepion pharaonis]|uniref:Uncharacterized protein n=1 Tax=Acanthosepion pharaonis TaxID=158019 RepID=A0A812DBD4_ACAPH|nr:unnamed protein product [Sepia pharaonis]